MYSDFCSEVYNADGPQCFIRHSSDECRHVTVSLRSIERICDDIQHNACACEIVSAWTIAFQAVKREMLYVTWVLTCLL